MAELIIRGELVPRGPAGALILTDDQVQAIGGAKKTPPVRVTVNGHSFSGRIARMRGENLLGVSKANRAACGIEMGQPIEAQLVLDEAPRTVELPVELADALAGEPGARAAFDALAYTTRKEHARSVAEAKKPETRERRIAAVLATLRQMS